MSMNSRFHFLTALLTTFLLAGWPGKIFGLDSRLPARLIAADSSGASSSFGTALAVAGDWLAVGDNGYDAGRGAVWLFNRNAGGAGNWGLVKQLTAPNAQSGDFLGFSLALSAEWLVVGATGDGQSGTSAGRLHLFRRHQGGSDNWGYFGSLSPLSARASDGLGQSVALQGPRLVAGAMGRDQLAGAAFVFEYDADTDAWVERGELAPELVAEDRFGSSVDLDGDLVVVGARGHEQFTGAAWVFRRHAGGWEIVKRLRAVDAQSNDQSGSTVALRNGLVAMGSRFNNEAGSQAGAVYLFAADAGGVNNWGQWRKLLPPLPRPNGQFGWSVDWDGYHLLVGAPAIGGPSAVWWFRIEPTASAEVELVRRLTAGLTDEGALRVGLQVRAQGHEVLTTGTVISSGLGRVALFGPAEATEYSESVLSDGPMLYYRFEQAHEFPFVRDASGQERHAAGQGLLPDSYSAGVPLGNALRFAGGPEHVQLPFLPELDTCTIEFWVKPRIANAAALTTHLIAGRPTDPGAFALLLDENLRLRLDVVGNTPASVVLMDAPGGTPGWAHLVVTYDAPARVARAYRNGELKGGAGFQTALPLRWSQAWLGRHPFAPAAMTGFLDEVAVYARVLSAGTIGAHHGVVGGNLRIQMLAHQGNRALLSWTGGRAPYQLEAYAELPAANPFEVRSLRFPQSLIPATNERAFFRIRQPGEP
jgi:hypothetical protein